MLLKVLQISQENSCFLKVFSCEFCELTKHLRATALVFWTSKKHLMQNAGKCWNKDRSSRPELFCKNGVLKNFLKFTGTHLCWSLLFNKVVGLRLASSSKKLSTLWKKSLRQRCFLLNFSKFFRNSIFIEHLRWLLLQREVFVQNDLKQKWQKPKKWDWWKKNYLAGGQQIFQVAGCQFVLMSETPIRFIF